MGNRVIVGISGGVDSSVAAYLLKQQGYEVVGVTFRFVADSELDDAIKVASDLEIEHHVIDYRDEFKSKIIDNFINDYKNGITPNPCVNCNRDVKIKLLYEYMNEFKCDYLATGHYAKINEDGLFMSSDLNKDQTYFLCQVPKYILDKMVLPLEGVTKDEVRKIANDANLISAHKKDSLDVCFIKTSFSDFMNEYIPTTVGDVINVDTGEIVGKHKGLSFYTIGQRRGLDIGGFSDRMFVVGKDMNKNILYVSIGEEKGYLLSDECLVENVNYISKKKVDNCLAKFRYRQELSPVKIEWIDDTTILVKYDSLVKSVTPGQACVLYLDNECLGGGIIKEVRKNGEKLWYL